MKYKGIKSKADNRKKWKKIDGWLATRLFKYMKMDDIQNRIRLNALEIEL